MKNKKLYIVCFVLLLCSGVAKAIQYPQYSGHAAECQYSAPNRYESSVSMADQWYEERMGSYLATDPYGDESEVVASAPYRASRPGGGTGVIPNPAPVGDGVWVLLAMAVLYMIGVRKAHTA